MGALTAVAYQVRLDNFEGPLDLLLHLVQRAELDIYDIPIARITQQYLETLEEMQSLDLDLASEFVVMAATLLQIKARMLFPRPSAPSVEVPDGGAEADPRQELIERLVTYNRFKQAAEFLAQRASSRARHFTRWAEPPEPSQPADPLGSISLFDLLAALQRALARTEPRVWPEIPPEEVTLREKMETVLVAVRTLPQGVPFRSLFGAVPRRLEVVVTFLAVLELLRLQQVLIRQDRPFGELLLVPRDSVAAAAPDDPGTPKEEEPA